MPDAREVIAVVVTIGSFSLLGGFIFTGGHLDSGTGVGLVAFCSGSLGSVLGFYFGKTNGAQAQLAASTASLADQATAILVAAGQRRSGDVTVTAPSGPITVSPSTTPTGTNT